jgi:hypothetical protein
MKKWPRIVGRIDIKRSKFAEYLFNNAIRRDDSVLRKRSCMCIGILVASLTKQEFNSLLFNNGVIGYLKSEKKEDKQSLERRRYALQIFSNILKAQNPNIQESAQ